MKNLFNAKTKASTPIFKPMLMLLLFLLCGFYAEAQLPWLHVEGNQIKDPQGNPVTLRGYSLLPNEHNNECNNCNKKPLSEVVDMATNTADGWHPRVVRHGVTTAKVKDPATSFAVHIDPFVQQLISKGVYVVVDLHLVANYDYNGSGGVSQQFLLDFWNYVAPRYANNPEVIFELYNEPINPDCWSCWKEYIQPVVDAIRAVAPNNLIFMGGPQWSTRVNQAVNDPIVGNNIVYVYHIYPNQGAASTSNLDTKFGNASNSIPITISEFGWNSTAQYSDGVTNGTTSGWGVPFRQYLDSHSWISWQSYIFDNYWKPQYFDHSWNLMGGENQGQFMKQWLFETKDHNWVGGGSNMPPVAAFSFNTTDLTAEFDASSSSDADGSIASYQWDFGDGATGSGVTTSHTYATGGSYAVTLTVTDNAGATDSEQQVVTVSSSGGGSSSLHVESITEGSQNAGQGSKKATAMVFVHDDQGNPVANASVSGTFSGDFNESQSGQTGQDGTVTLATDGVKKGSLNFDFCVDGITHASLAYAPADNVITCTGSAGSRTMAVQPVPGSTAANDASAHALLVYPNPMTAGEVIIQYKGEIDKDTYLRIFSSSGQEFFNTRITSPKIHVAKGNLSAGVYFIQIHSKGEKYSERLIIE